MQTPNFPKTQSYIQGVNLTACDPIDKKVAELIADGAVYERASQALRRRFVRGAEMVGGIDRGGRKTRIRREGSRGKYKYSVEGSDSSWSEPAERIWVVAMYALWQERK